MLPWVAWRAWCPTSQQSSVADLQKDVEAAGTDLKKTPTRVQDLQGHVQRMQAIGAEELERRSVVGCGFFIVGLACSACQLPCVCGGAVGGWSALLVGWCWSMLTRWCALLPAGMCRCQSQLLDTEAALSKLREQQRHAEERSSYGQTQLGMMNDLLQLLQLKQQLAAAAVAANSPSKASGREMLMSEGRWAPAGPATAASGFNTNVMVL